MRRLTAIRAGIGLGLLGALLVGTAAPATAATLSRDADDVYVALPLPVHINGTGVPVTVAVLGDKVRVGDEITVVLRNGKGEFRDEVIGTYTGKPLTMRFSSTWIGTWQAEVAKVTRACTYTGADVLTHCEQDYSAGPWYEVITGFTAHPSRAVTAKVDSRTQLVTYRTAKGSVWAAHVTHYTRDHGWVPWRNKVVKINSHFAITDAKGNVRLSGKGARSPHYTVQTFTTDHIWGSKTTLLVP